MRFSVVIPTYNRKHTLRQCLAALARQDYADYEVIVVDDGSRDGTDAMLAAEFPTIRYLRQANQGQAVARNRGIEAGTGESVAFTDDDNVVPADWLSRMADGFRRHPEVSGVGGRMEPPEAVWRRNVFARLELWTTRYTYGLTPDRPEFVAEGLEAPGATNNCAYRRAVLLAVGGFHPQPTRVVVGEEREMRERMLDAGYLHYLYVPTVALHLREYTLRGFLTQSLEAGLGIRRHRARLARGQKLWPEVARSRRGRFAGLHEALAARDVKLAGAIVLERLIAIIGRLLPEGAAIGLILAISRLGRRRA